MTGTSQYRNISKVDMSGYEGKITWTPNEKFKVILNYTFTDAENKETLDAAKETMTPENYENFKAAMMREAVIRDNKAN